MRKIGKMDWRAEYESMIGRAANDWYVRASRCPFPFYIWHRPAVPNGEWGNILICAENEKPETHGYVLSTPERIPYCADRRYVINTIKKLNLPVIGE